MGKITRLDVGMSRPKNVEHLQKKGGETPAWVCWDHKKGAFKVSPVFKGMGERSANVQVSKFDAPIFKGKKSMVSCRFYVKPIL